MAWKKFPHSLWKEGVNYYIDRSQYQSQMLYNDVRTAFQRAAKLWESNTCINFTEDASAKNRIKIHPGPTCNSYVGKNGGEQTMMLGSSCAYTYMAAHEIGHALGFMHTFQRHDRDKYITLNENAIVSSYYGDFMKMTPEQNDNFGLPYDYGDVMHYPAN
ncbi:astacin [Teladorsagia circumcincta]|uniref:Metalloendopeptidase n=1 Tax=Teladorsagia circumcincta TaxID=45464 RepID=A0A2G9UR58_TELCI|nr:astacin [Teladorsagia circumcincta]